ncbi:CehA/McbA family metallohydrolase [Vallitalea okinawensis]|uniref:CehA/McbA family metallohydrolase n=1 Tax=Vallitalea okinawensis TaxID=2078660 RepID=UPI000CFA9704|nr:CehA/McbA family metallohydrolase [Vallitalea okinawensis]
MQILFDNYYYKEDVNTTFTYDFEVPKGAERIEVFIEVEQPPKPNHGRPDLVGVGLKHKEKLRAWNCTHRKYLMLTEEFGTPGTLPGEIEEGKWQLVVFPRTKNEIQRVRVVAKVVITLKHYRFVAGDTHMHTVHSDGRLSIPETIQSAKEVGLEFIFITDHNIASANQSLPCDQEILVAPGVEYGLEAGHVGMLGVATPIEDFTWDPQWECYEWHLKEAKEKGCGIGINHPFCNDSPWLKDFEQPVDWIEIWNGMWRPVNEKAVQWWHQQLLQGKKIPVVGGSDCHGPGIFRGHGIPTTHLYTQQLTTESLVEAMKNGKVYITLNNQCPKLNLYTEHNVLGDTTLDREVHIELMNLNIGDVLHVITNENEEIILLEDRAYCKKVIIQNEKFVRIEVKRLLEFNEDGFDCEGWVTILLSNPIYFAGGNGNE